MRGWESSSSLVCIQHKQQHLSIHLRASHGNKKQTELGADALRPNEETIAESTFTGHMKSGFRHREVTV